MSQQILVTTGEVDRLAHRIQSGASNISGELSQLQSGVQQLINEGWKGTASGAFHDMYQEWQNSANNLNTALEGISTLLIQAATAYGDTETSVAGAMHFS
jgi:WXG100 family type VII secretion target